LSHTTCRTLFSLCQGPSQAARLFAKLKPTLDKVKWFPPHVSVGSGTRTTTHIAREFQVGHGVAVAGREGADQAPADGHEDAHRACGSRENLKYTDAGKGHFTTGRLTTRMRPDSTCRTHRAVHEVGRAVVVLTKSEALIRKSGELSQTYSLTLK